MCKPESYQHMSSDNCICLRNIHALSRYNTWPSPNKILSEVFHSTEETSNSFNLFLFPSWMNLACCRTLKKKKRTHNVCVWMGTRLFTKHHVFEMCPWFYMYQWSVPFYCWILSHDFISVCVSILHLWPSRLFLDFGQFWIKWLW